MTEARVKIAPSLLSADFGRLAEAVQACESAGPTPSTSTSWTGGSSPT